MFSTSATSGKPTAAQALSYGFTAYADTTTITPVTIYENTGKVFGRLGVGKMNHPSYTTAYRSALASTHVNYMWISMFPTSKTVTAIATEWNIMQVEVAAITSFDAPSRPGSASNPDTGAAYVAATFAATAAVVASLY